MSETNTRTSQEHNLPLTHEQALPYAQQQLGAQLPPQGYVYQLSPGKRVKQGWYFDYELDLLNKKDGDEPDYGFGGAPGFLVTDAGEIQIVMNGQLSALFPQGDSP